MSATTNEFGPDKPCQRTACADQPPHLGGEHINPRSALYDGPDTTIGALPGAARRAARALLAAGASVPEVVDMAEEILRLREQVAAVRVDADRQVRRAMDRALDCADHGKTIRDLEMQGYHFDQQARRNDAGRLALLSGLWEVRDFVRALADGRGGDKPLTTKVLAQRLAQAFDKISAAHDRAWRDDKPTAKATPRRAAAPEKQSEPAPAELEGQGELFAAGAVNR